MFGSLIYNVFFFPSLFCLEPCCHSIRTTSVSTRYSCVCFNLIAELFGLRVFQGFFAMLLPRPVKMIRKDNQEGNTEEKV